MNIKPHKFAITGISPLLLKSPQGIQPSDGTLKQKKIDKPEVEAERCAYRMASGQLYLPCLHFRQGIIYASRGKKQGKRSAAAILAASVFIGADKCPLTDAKKKPLHKYEIDTRPAVINKGRVPISRPILQEWSTVVELQIDEDMIDTKMILSLLIEAGTISGAGDYRPQKGGWFGRYDAALIS